MWSFLLRLSSRFWSLSDTDSEQLERANSYSSDLSLHIGVCTAHTIYYINASGKQRVRQKAVRLHLFSPEQSDTISFLLHLRRFGRFRFCSMFTIYSFIFHTSSGNGECAYSRTFAGSVRLDENCEPTIQKYLRFHQSDRRARCFRSRPIKTQEPLFYIRSPRIPIQPKFPYKIKISTHSLLAAYMDSF